MLNIAMGLRQAPVLFGQKPGNREAGEKAEQILREAGLPAELRKSKVKLWHIAADKHYLHIQVDTSRNRKFDLAAFEKRLAELLKDLEREVNLLPKKIADFCCGNGCPPCLSGNPDNRKNWSK